MTDASAPLASRDAIGRRVARMMLEVGAIHIRPEEPFIFTSGWASPVYTDCRKLISYPRLRKQLMDDAAATILREAGYESLDAVAGGETAGIPFAAWIAERLMLPMLYVRKKPKGFGRNARIEGAVVDGQRTILVEDLTTDGGSKVAFAEALREAGQIVEHAFVIFHYGIFPESRQTMERIGVKLHELATFWDVLAVAKEDGKFDAGKLADVEAFLNKPAEWSAAHGGKASFGAS
ncbi:orotate phosphoribosyltransferase [Methylopila jiangsuensis]|uniref:Orotate phosphoribosyltransferase n=1 Tax=Methylopila jiangsuensis TaxID=586230 RepID=A0A9W6JFX7_9HYPH|nr:orotate phosphoribosyltransferase [Methylopila jiangsuensis]MDR6287227.1 orotate phosphoribosyltransferase [Methylopila jiangsuensis]GLK74813.1 orotate phosphoribosyltransferase [Methylopila jiangsuensis]